MELLLQRGNTLKVDWAMCMKLFQVAVLFRTKGAANALIKLCKTSDDTDALLQPFVERVDLASTRWIIGLEAFGNLGMLRSPIVELACQARDLQALSIAPAHGADVDLYQQMHPLAAVLESMQSPLDLRLANLHLIAKCSVSLLGRAVILISSIFFASW